MNSRISGNNALSNYLSAAINLDLKEVMEKKQVNKTETDDWTVETLTLTFTEYTHETG